MSSIIKIEELSKSYDEIIAVKRLNLEVKKGEMFGLVGPDGAGKTTTIRMMCGLINPDSGSIEIFNKDMFEQRKIIQKNIGYLSQKFSLYGDLTVDENIEFSAEIHNVSDYKNRRDELLRFTRLEAFRSRLADKLSGGMKQKLALACGLIHKPEIIFLDEPTTGVDPVSRRDFWKILSALVKDGLTVFMTTPYLDEAERCNRVAMMAAGKIIALDKPQGIKNLMKGSLFEIVCSEVRKAVNILKSEMYLEIQVFGDRLNLALDAKTNDIKSIIKRLEAKGIIITSSREITPSLENVFIQLIKENDLG